MLSLALLVAIFIFLALALTGGRRWWVVGWLFLAAGTGAAFVWFTDSYEIRKLLGTLAMPAGAAWLCLLVAAAVASKRTPKWFSAGVWATWLLVGVAGNVWLGNYLVGRLEAPYSGGDPFTVETMDAVAVLGGGVSANSAGQFILGPSADRAVLGARLERAGRTRLLISTGPPIAATDDEVTVPEATAALWRLFGVPEHRMLLAAGPRTTGEEIARIAELQAEHGWQRLGLVSSGYHLRRAELLCRQQGLEVIPLAADLNSPDPRLRPLHLIPQAGGFDSMHQACWEMLGALLVR